jgi:hypothetical protein
MDMDNWLDEFQSLLGQFKAMERRFSLDINEILPVQGKFEVLDRLVQDFNLSEEFRDFYRKCGGITLTNIWNGYWIFGFEENLHRHEVGEPTRVVGISLEVDVLVFGGNGGGGRFAIETSGSGRVLYLPSDGRVEFSNWSSDEELCQPQILSNTFEEFLNRLLGDVRAEVNQTPGWEYIPCV